MMEVYKKIIKGVCCKRYVSARKASLTGSRDLYQVLAGFEPYTSSTEAQGLSRLFIPSDLACFIYFENFLQALSVAQIFLFWYQNESIEFSVDYYQKDTG